MSEDEVKHVVEITGPPMAYFEIPLDWTHAVTEEFRRDTLMQNVRMIQRIMYFNFYVEGETKRQCLEASEVVYERVCRELQSIEGMNYPIIWWRLRPTIDTIDTGWLMRMRLGTSPSLSPGFWEGLMRAVGNRPEGAVP